MSEAELPVLISEAVDLLSKIVAERREWAARNKTLGNYEDAAMREREANALEGGRLLLLEIEKEGSARDVIMTLRAVRRHDRAVRSFIHRLDQNDKQPRRPNAGGNR